MDEIHIMGDMSMDEGWHTHAHNNPKRINNGDQGSKYGSGSINIQMVIHNGGLNERMNTMLI